MLILLLFFMTFVAGLGFGYMLFSHDCNLKKCNYVLIRKNQPELKCKFKSVRTKTWDNLDGLGKITYEYVELVEDEK